MTAAEVLREIYGQLPRVACRRKCGHQVCGPVLASPAELAAMLERAGRPLEYSAEDLTCGYLDRVNGVCQVHAVRPLLCRLYGAAASPQMQCPHGCVADRVVTDAQVQEWLDRLARLDGAARLGRMR